MERIYATGQRCGQVSTYLILEWADVNVLCRNATHVTGESAIMDRLREMKNSFRG